MFNKELYFSRLQTKLFGRNIYIYDSVGSTNDVLLEGSYENGDVVITNLQTKGRGRSGRVWEDNGESLIFSIQLSGLPVNMLMPFNIIAGFSVCDGISVYAESKMKWPNDCVINGKKVSGMLLEAAFSGNTPTKIVFGAGINVFNKSFPKAIEHRATSVFLNAKEEVKKEIILAEILNSMEKYTEMFLHNSLDIEVMWKNYSANIDKQISVHINNEKKDIIEKGINSSGELIGYDVSLKKDIVINTGETGYDFNS